jgi:hypothetical protein
MNYHGTEVAATCLRTLPIANLWMLEHIRLEKIN